MTWEASVDEKWDYSRWSFDSVGWDHAFGAEQSLACSTVPPIEC